MAKESDDDFCSPNPPRSLLAAPRCAHVNRCLDTQESSNAYEKAKDKWNNVVDCPMCGEPQPPGPHRSAHAKRCGKAYNITPKELLKLMETQQRICNAKKHHNMVHTKAPVPVKKEVLPAKLKGAPNSSLEENLQLARALSASMITKANDENCDTSPQVKRVFDPNEKKRKRPRSYAVVELAPRACKCELDRLERLSQDMHRLVEQESLADIRIQCIDGSVNGHRCLLQARTSLMCKPSQTVCQSVEINEGQKIVKYWLQYVYSGRVEWEKDDTVRIQKIAEQYGPGEQFFTIIRTKTT
uniref:BTB domain-containing protein n=1 Tax=Angiostrongylus cantonensis TaxID=6313 RepID=A0A158PAW4_ANGCA